MSGDEKSTDPGFSVAERKVLRAQEPKRPSDAVVIFSIGFQNLAQVCRAQNNDVVQTLAPDRSDQPFGKAILPR
jgi:hypothetical protein